MVGLSVVWLIDDVDMMVDEIDLITGTDFFAFACFDFAVDAHQTIGDRLFGAATRLTKALELEDLVKFDKFGLKLSNDVFWITHDYASKSM